MNDFITWEFLATFAGVVAAVTALTEITKQFISLNLKWISLLLSAIVVLGGSILVLGKTDGSKILLSCINVFVVCGAATGTYKHLVEPIENALKN